MNTNGASGEDCEKIRWKSSTGGCTNFSPRASTTNNLTALYTRSDGRVREGEGGREREGVEVRKKMLSYHVILLYVIL